MHKALAMQANTITHTHRQTDVRILTRKKNKQRGALTLTSVLSLFHSLLRSHDAAPRHRRRNVNTQRKPILLTFGCVQQRRSLMGAAQLTAERVRGQSKHNENNKLWQIKTIRPLSPLLLLLLLFLATCCLNKCAFRMRRERREQQQHKFLSVGGESKRERGALYKNKQQRNTYVTNVCVCVCVCNTQRQQICRAICLSLFLFLYRQV